MTKIISIHSYRGGTGKSNTTANLAATAALLGKRVALVDTDIQSPGVNILFGLKDDQIKHTLNDYLWGRCEIKEVTHDVSAVLNGEGGSIYLIPSSMKSDNIAKVLSEGYDVELLQEGLYQLNNLLNLDYLFIDTHPGINEETLLSIGISDTLIIILRPDQQDYLGTAVVIEVAENLEVPQMLLVVNQVLPDFDLKALRQKVEATYNKPVAGIMPLSTEMIRLGSQGLFSLQYPDHELTAGYKEIVSHI
ncbi:CDP-3,6-dideoxy-D-glycero-L-glycero-4-hexulose-4-reductase [Scytonema hofmannii PCC 7110]|uniref:CDP-3, 6-dideoxy-D-glycero-L-glycero-4-hexulose-4-reductase n=1 Tax=Scytonema hofmannii PCC 7110 TaxID=128403 RepID=A0A139X1M2_9CYAN|nr:MinD/ParA family protein [Scytonema hofmannii]KYC38607.1 CDP-3,6-dideoxy-D-glycero-L-glycero-4-hexulose-4-reductase [Scytonema hofmannii PCC 7110]